MRPRLARRFKASAFEGSLEGQVGFGGEGGGGGGGGVRDANAHHSE